MNATALSGRIPLRLIFLAVPLAALGIGAALGTLATDGAPTRIYGGPEQGSRLATLNPVHAPAIETKSSEGFTVDFQRSESDSNGTLAVYYKVQSQGHGRFADMLGIPRVFNPDGSVVLPSEYGSVGSSDGVEGGIPGVPAGSLGALYDAASVQPGAFIRFGPFFRSSDEALSLTATGADLTAGREAVIGGERFVVTAVANGDGTTSIQFVNIEPGATVVATHPGSKVTVAIDGKAVPEIHGSTNFAKTVGYDVNANRSTIDIAGWIPEDAEVTVTSSSIGRVHRGAWDFPLD
jgi:hypothetical protein